jgi:hypothetical protein
VRRTTGRPVPRAPGSVPKSRWPTPPGPGPSREPAITRGRIHRKPCRACRVMAPRKGIAVRAPRAGSPRRNQARATASSAAQARQAGRHAAAPRRGPGVRIPAGAFLVPPLPVQGADPVPVSCSRDRFATSPEGARSPSSGRRGLAPRRVVQGQHVAEFVGQRVLEVHLPGRAGRAKRKIPVVDLQAKLPGRRPRVVEDRGQCDDSRDLALADSPGLGILEEDHVVPGLAGRVPLERRELPDPAPPTTPRGAGDVVPGPKTRPDGRLGVLGGTFGAEAWSQKPGPRRSTTGGASGPGGGTRCSRPGTRRPAPPPPRRSGWTCGSWSGLSA